MRIITIDAKDGSHQECGIEVPLRRLAASPNQLEAAYWRMMLDLVEHLASTGTEPVLFGNIFLKQMWLIRPIPSDPRRDQESREKFLHETRKFAGEPDASVTLRVDWRDYAPLRDGIPQMHYRIEIKRPGQNLTEEARAQNSAECERVLRQAFGW